MVYKNFIQRLLFSLLFILVYFICSIINFGFVFYLILFIYILVCYEVYIYFKNYKLYPFIYIFISFTFFIFIDFKDDIFLSFNLFILTVIVFDIFSYIVGKFIGKNKLIKISPNKTIEGLCGGVFIALISSLSFAYYFNININLKLFTHLSIIILFAFFGDILESYFKRRNNLKNSSEFIPGHGGVFDRFDSFLFSIIFYSISNNILQ